MSDINVLFLIPPIVNIHLSILNLIFSKSQIKHAVKQVKDHNYPKLIC